MLDSRSAKKNIRKRVFLSDPSKLADEVANLCDAVEVLVSKKSTPSTIVIEKEGKQGPQGEPGLQGPPGPAGFTPEAGIDFQIPKDGAPGRDGEDGKDGEPGRDGELGTPGKDGSPDSPSQIRQKLESLKGDQRLDVRAIRGLEKRDKTLTETWNEILKHIPIGGVSDFKQLHDVPQTYTGQSGKTVKVNSTETGLEFGAAVTTFTPVRGESHTVSVDGASTVTALHIPLYGASAWVNGSRIETSVVGDQVTVLTDVYKDDLILLDYEY